MTTRSIKAVFSLIKIALPGETLTPISSSDLPSGHLASFVLYTDATQEEIDDIQWCIQSYILANDPNRWVAVYDPSVWSKFHVSAKNVLVAYCHDEIAPNQYKTADLSQLIGG